MFIAYLMIGTAAGLVAAVSVYLAGFPIWIAVTTYSLGGSIGMLFAALVAHGLTELRTSPPGTTSRAPSLSR